MQAVYDGTERVSERIYEMTEMTSMEGVEYSQEREPIERENESECGVKGRRSGKVENVRGKQLLERLHRE